MMRSVGHGIFLVAFTLASFLSHARSAAWNKEFVEIRPGHKLYVEHRVAGAGKPTVFLLNGLTWSTEDWSPFTSSLSNLDPEVGIVLYDMQGMGKTLLLDPKAEDSIPYENQVEDLHDLKQTLNISGPTFLAGLSYGGGVALYSAVKYPHDFDQVIAFAPYIERLSEQDKYIEMWVNTHLLLVPFETRTREKLYRYYLRAFIFSLFPMAEPALLDNPYKLNAVFRLIEGARSYRAVDYKDQFPKNKVHLISAQDDDLVKEPTLVALWNQIPGASFLRLERTGHQIPAERPTMAAAWVHRILSRHPAISGGRVFEGDPNGGKARSEDLVIDLKKAAGCESLL